MNMNIRRIFSAAAIPAILIFLVIPFSLLSCGFFGGKIPTRNYYILSALPSTQTAVRKSHPYSLQVDRCDVQRIFSRQNIVYRFSANRIQYYEYQQWAVRPDYMITDLVYKYIDSAGIFSRVGTEFLDVQPDFRIDGTVDAIEKFDAGDILFAHLAMKFSMVRTSDGRQVWGYAFDERKRVYQSEMVYTVIALSQILQQQMNTIAGQIDSLMTDVTSGGSLPTGPSAAPSAITPVLPSPPPDTTGSDIQNPGYEIIPESKIRRK